MASPLTIMRRVSRSVRERPGSAVIDWDTCPARFRGNVSAVVRNRQEADTLVDFYGHADWIPNMPVVVLLPNEAVLIGIQQRTQPMTAAQLQRQAEQLYAHEQAVMEADTHGLILREKGGPLAPVDVQPYIRQQLNRQSGRF